MSFPSCIKIPLPRTGLPSEGIDNYTVVRDPVTYEQLISIANTVFGEGRWSHAITSQTVDFVEYVMGKYHIGCAAFVRVQLTDGTFHEDMGYSNTESSVKGSAIKSARSLSIATALKKALLCFGGIMEEKINENMDKNRKDNREYRKPRGGRISDSPMKVAPIKDNNPAKESRTTENYVSCVQENSGIEQSLSNPVKMCSEPKIISGLGPAETNGNNPVVNDIDDKDKPEGCRESDNTSDSRSNLPTKDEASVPLTEEEIRLERKRKQKQKQEEYKKLMKEKLLKSGENKPNSRY